MPGFDGTIRKRERPRAILVDHRLDDVEQQIASHQPQHRGDVFHRDRLAGKRDHLIERALCIAHAAFRRSRHQRERVA